LLQSSRTVITQPQNQNKKSNLISRYGVLLNVCVFPPFFPCSPPPPSLFPPPLSVGRSTPVYVPKEGFKSSILDTWGPKT
jgi:hypothetical protein